MHYNVSRHKVSTKISARALCPSAELGGRAAVLCSGMDFIADACSEHMSGRASRDKHRTGLEQNFAYGLTALRDIHCCHPL